MTERAPPLVLVGPSGAGKTTLAHRLVAASDRYRFSISATTRPPREGERDGVDYHFVDRGRFEAMVAAGELAEWAEVHGRCYGTPRAALDAIAGGGRHAVLDIDVQGARQIRAAVPDAVLIFVLPPSVDIMMTRLVGRGTEEPAEIAARLRTALEELTAVSEFDHVVVNDDIDACLERIRAIAERDRPAVDARSDVDPEAYRAGIRRVLAEEYDDTSNH